MSVNKKKSSSSSSSSSSDDGKPKTYYQSTIPGQQILQQQIVQPQQQVVYQSGVMQSGMVHASQMQTLNTLPVGITEEQIRRSLAGVSLETVKGEVRSEYIPLTRVEVEYKEDVQYEQIPRQVKVTDYYQVEYQQEHIPQVLQHTITEYVPQQKIIPQVNYKAIEKTYTRPEIIAGEVRVEQGAAEIISSQIIQTESTAHTIAYPQIPTSGVTYTQGPQIAQYSTTVMPQTYIQQGKRKSSSIKYTTTQMIQPQMQMAMSPSRIQMAQPMRQYSQTAQMQALPMQTMQMQMPMQTLPMQTIQTMPMQTIPTASIKYTNQPMQTIGAPAGFQQQVFQQSAFPQAAPMYMNGTQPGMPMSNFQGVRLADSHILMK